MPTPHSTDNYTVGKGILYIATWDGSIPPEEGDYLEMGNAPSVEWEPTLERLPHFSSRHNFKLKDKNPVIQTDYTINFTLDELASVNLTKFLIGTLDGNVIHGMQSANAEYALKFVSDNPIGSNNTWEFWKVTLQPSGALALIGDEWITMAFTAEGLADIANHSSSPYFDVTMATTTTTTTT